MLNTAAKLLLEASRETCPTGVLTTTAQEQKHHVPGGPKHKAVRHWACEGFPLFLFISPPQSTLLPNVKVL